MQEASIKTVLALMSVEQVDELIDKISTLEMQNDWDSQNTILIEAAYRSPPIVFYRLLPFLNVFPRDNTKEEWYHLVCRGRHDIVFFMLSYHSQYLRKTNVGGDNYLMATVRQAKCDESIDEAHLIANLPAILHSSVDINRENKNMESALYLAIEAKWFALAKVMMTHPDFRFSDYVDASSGDWKIYKLILDRKYYGLLQFMFAKGFMTNRKTISTHLSPLSSLWYKYYNEEKSPILLECITLLVAHTQGVSTADFARNPNVLDYRKTYLERFNRNVSSEKAIDKSVALKMVCARMAVIMSSVDVCVNLLSKFEHFLQAAWINQFGQATIPDFQVDMKMHAGLLWPVPVESVQSTKAKAFSKKGFLQQQCVAFLDSLGVKCEFYKLYGFLNAEKFEQLIIKSSLFTELSLNPGFLLHGKHIHNIGRMIFHLAWKSNTAFQQQYIENGETKTLTTEDFFSILLKKEYAVIPTNRTHKTQWALLFDIISPYDVTLSDFHQLHTFLLSRQKELPLLSSLTRHSFGKSVYRIRDFLNDTTHKQFTIEESWRYFITADAPSRATDYTKAQVRWLRDKGKIGNDVVIDENNLQVLHRFSPKK